MDELTDKLDLKQVMDRNVEHLSGGELQRFAIAVCAASSSDVYMVDEPSSYLDVRQRLKAAQVRPRAVCGVVGCYRDWDLAAVWSGVLASLVRPHPCTHFHTTKRYQTLRIRAVQGCVALLTACMRVCVLFRASAWHKPPDLWSHQLRSAAP
jgi:ABC-type cobalamin/Fe3+-siderophores transport system ATPase subunit